VVAARITQAGGPRVETHGVYDTAIKFRLILRLV